ncbi:hypothetical protein FA15DRAFT_662297 [Coprinopsis marcescibilis]|uniref:Dilute domain-containing protein n=1 Tax=Coprinopsis marcescibilis TaxID=230819 RepID=A0A5C3LC25_COPMA|nr:hypothetical protein FA15DRAFT_662297 [Coprinopsis marcescibilis]
MTTALNLEPEPDLHPLYPTSTQLVESLSPESGLDPVQKAELVAHCLKRAALFGDLLILQFLFTDPLARVYADLSIEDEDGVGLVSLAIHGFGGDLDRDVEREECVRYLVSQGADLKPDKSGWTPLHHAAIMAPPTLVSYLMTHGCSVFDVTSKKLTALDIVSAHSIIPDREDVALLLEEAMRGEGWTGGPVEQRRRLHERRERRKGKRRAIRDDVSKVLGVNPRWWEPDTVDSGSDSDEEDATVDESIYTPPADFGSMLVFSPSSLPQILDAVITNFPISLKNPTPAHTLYLLARFACLTCDHMWLEDLVIGATDAIEEAFFNDADDIQTLAFWLHNTTLWLHLMQCDKSLRPACEMLGSFELVEEVINSVFVFIIRFTERRIDQLLDTTILDYAPLGSESETVQFESEWAFLRPFTKKKAPPPIGVGSPRNQKSAVSSSPTTSTRSLASSRSFTTLSPTIPKFSSLKRTIARAQAGSKGVPLASLFPEVPTGQSPYELTSFLTALHTLLAFADINPIFTAQLWSQVFYWMSCEIFNRVITRKKYICRSRALQISANMSVVEEWTDEMGIPPGVLSHFAPVKDLLNWLQCLSSVAEFPDLVAVIQSLKQLNPLQMRRAVRDYKYEVSESRMTDECVQYIIQLQKDWERHRVKLGVEILRKEISERERERSDQSPPLSIPTKDDDQVSIMSSVSNMSLDTTHRSNIDILMDRSQDKSVWQPLRAPQALGELLDSRHMIPLLFPDDPKLLAALPSRAFLEEFKGSTPPSAPLSPGSGRSSMDLGNTGALLWRSRDSKIREAGLDILQLVDGARPPSQWWKNLEKPSEAEYHSDDDIPATIVEDPDDLTLQFNPRPEPTPLTRKPSGRSKGRASLGEVTPIDGSFNFRPSPLKQ